MYLFRQFICSLNFGWKEINNSIFCINVSVLRKDVTSTLRSIVWITYWPSIDAVTLLLTSYQHSICTIQRQCSLFQTDAPKLCNLHHKPVRVRTRLQLTATTKRDNCLLIYTSNRKFMQLTCSCFSLWRSGYCNTWIRWFFSAAGFQDRWFSRQAKA